MNTDADQPELAAQLAEASSEDSDVETDEEIPQVSRLLPTTTDTISSIISGDREMNFPVNYSTPPEQQKTNKQKYCLLVLTHSLVFILGLYIGGKLLFNRRV